MSNVVKVMGFGTFDGLHPGHLSYLEQLRDLGEEVTIVVARDANVIKIKGRPCRHTENIRLARLIESGLANQVLLGHPTDFFHWLRELSPHIIGLGYDQRADETLITEHFPAVQIVRLEAFEPEKHKSSIILGKGDS